VLARLSPHERDFDAGCKWPSAVGDAERPRFSLHDGIADFFMHCNGTRCTDEIDDVTNGKGGIGKTPLRGKDTATTAKSVQQHGKRRRLIVSFSHFIPRAELYKGYSQLGSGACGG
jgi:hypothetical protein